MTGVLCALAGAGDNNTQVVTVGFFDDKTLDYYGYSTFAAVGSISDGTFDLKGGATITELTWDTGSRLVFALNGTLTNADWTNVTISGQTFTRASASFSQSGGQTYWQWSASTNPFGTTVGATVNCVFT